MEPMSDASSYERVLMQRAWDNKIPINGSLELLPLCNMNCDMCYVRLSKKEMDAIGKMRTAKEWLSIGTQMKDAGVVFLLLTGGEPLLHPEFKEIYLGLRNLGMIITINTNGTLIDEKWADFFAENPPRRINITLYGASSETYGKLCHYADGFDKTMMAITLLKERNLDIRLGCSVTRYNQQDLEEIFAIREKLKIFTIADTYMVSATRERERDFAYEARLSPEEAAKRKVYVLKETIGKENWPEYLSRKIFEVQHIVPEDNYGKVTCYAGNCSFAINWQGEMRPCVTMTTPSAQVFDLGFEEAWKQIRKKVDQINTSKKCQRCNLRPICSSCAGNAIVETGSYLGVPDYLCRYSKETYRLMLIEAEKYKKEAENESN